MCSVRWCGHAVELFICLCAFSDARTLHVSSEPNDKATLPPAPDLQFSITVLPLDEKANKILRKIRIVRMKSDSKRTRRQKIFNGLQQSLPSGNQQLFYPPQAYFYRSRPENYKTALNYQQQNGFVATPLGPKLQANAPNLLIASNQQIRVPQKQSLLQQSHQLYSAPCSPGTACVYGARRRRNVGDVVTEVDMTGKEEIISDQWIDSTFQGERVKKPKKKRQLNKLFY